MIPRPRTLFVTAWWPQEGTWTATAGIARRQRLLYDGLVSGGLPIDVLLILAPSQYDGSSEAADEIRDSIVRQWPQVGVVSVCCWKAEPRDSLWQRFVIPALHYRHQRDFARFGSAAVLKAFESAITPQTAAILVQGLRCMTPILNGAPARLPVLFDLDDVEHVSFRRRVSEPPVWLSKRLEYLQIPALMYAEFRAIRRARHTFVCSTLDQVKLKTLFRSDRIEVIPNAMPLRQAGAPARQQTLLILGHYGFAPNRIGADDFIRNVWPQVHARCPSAQLVVAGADPHLLAAHAKQPIGVKFLGYVDDLDALYEQTRIVVCPILSGGGTRLKIMEAAAFGRPIVSTIIGAEGIELADGREILIGKDHRSLAELCIRLLVDHGAASALGAAAQCAIERLYSRERIVASIGAMVCEITGVEPKPAKRPNDNPASRGAALLP